MWRSCSQTSVSMAKMSSTKVARPTMFATRSRPPSRACASSTTLRAPSGSVTSPTTATPPTSSATFAARTGSRSATATRAPAWARSSDVSRPIPYPPPTTSAALPSNPNRSSNVIVASLRSLIRPLRPPPALFPSRHLHLAFATRRDTRLAHPHAISIWRSLLAGIPGSLTLTPSPFGVRYSPGYPARSRPRPLHLAFATRRDTRLAHPHAISIWRSLPAGIPGSLTLTPSPFGVRYSPGYPARSRPRPLHLAFATRRDTRLAHPHAISIWRSLPAGIPGSLTLTPSPFGVRYSPGYPARSRPRPLHLAFATRRDTRLA